MNGRATYEMTYTSLAMLARFKFIQIGKMAIRGQLGPRIDYLLSYSDYVEKFYLPGSYYFYWADNDDLQNFVFSANPGLAFEFEMKRTMIGVEISKAFSFNPAFDARGPRRDNHGDHGFFLKLRDQLFVISLIYARRTRSDPE